MILAVFIFMELVGGSIIVSSIGTDHFWSGLLAGAFICLITGGIVWDDLHS